MPPLPQSTSSCSSDSLDCFLQEDFDIFHYSPQHKRKRVRINGKPHLCGYIEHVSDLTPEERSLRWYSKDDFEETKKVAKSRCRELRRRGAFKRCLVNAYDQACNNATQPGHRIEETDSISSSRVIEPGTDLVDWCKDVQRGLERWTSKVHGFLRGKHAGEAKHAVLLEQARQFLVDERDETQMAKVATHASRSARLFAHLIGQADAAVVSTESRKRRSEQHTEDQPQQQQKVLKVEHPQQNSDDESASDNELQSPVFFDLAFSNN